MKTELLILWTGSDKGVALNMVFMYAQNSVLKGWWDDVTILIWGPSSLLSAGDEDIQKHIRASKEKGIRIIACKQCALNYDVVEKLEEQSIEVFFTGEFLSDWMKSNRQMLSV